MDLGLSALSALDVATDSDAPFDELIPCPAPLTELEQAEIVLGYLGATLGAMDRPTLATFRARYLAQSAAIGPHPRILELIEHAATARQRSAAE